MKSVCAKRSARTIRTPGSQIGFLTDRTGRWEVWGLPADGSNQRPLFLDAVYDQLEISFNAVDERVLSWGESKSASVSNRPILSHSSSVLLGMFSAVASKASRVDIQPCQNRARSKAFSLARGIKDSNLQPGRPDSCQDTAVGVDRVMCCISYLDGGNWQEPNEPLPDPSYE